MPMNKSLRRWRKERLISKVVLNGNKLRKAQASRAGVDAEVWPDDCAYLDTVINTLDRRHRRLLTALKEA